MGTVRKKRNLAAVKTETQKEHPRKGQSRNMSVPRINDEYITQASEETEGRVTKRLSPVFSRTEFRNLRALSKLDELLLNPQVQTHSRTYRNTNVENQEPNEDRSEDDPHSEVGPSVYQSRDSNDSHPGETLHSLRS